MVSRFVSMCLSIDALLSVGCVFSKRSHWGGKTGSPPPKSSGFVNDSRGNFGGGIAHLPSSSHWPSTSSPKTSEEEGLHLSLPPHNAGECLGGGRTGLPPRTVGVCFVHMVGENDELNILHSQTFRAATVEGDQAVFRRRTSAVT